MRIRLLMIIGLCVAEPLLADDPLAGLADPTRPSAYGSGGESGARAGLVLQSTVVSPERTLAVISGQRVAVGEKIQGAEVVAIRPYEVILNRAGKQSALRLLPKSDVEKRTIEAIPDANH
jgi:hypothetical protein